MKTNTAIFVSKCILKIANEGDNNDMTNLKMQKLLYYVQGTYISLHNKKFFNDDIVKWQYGPVVKAVYHHYKNFGNKIIEPCLNVNLNLLSDKHLEILRDVYSFFGKYSAITLMNFTHNESPWQNTEMGEIIKENEIKTFFDKIVVK